MKDLCPTVWSSHPKVFFSNGRDSVELMLSETIGSEADSDVLSNCFITIMK